MTRRLAAISAIAATAVLTLAGCTKPYPGVSVVSGTNTVREEALCWSFEESAVSAETCAQDVLQQAVQGDRLPRLTVVPGDTIGISVDPVIAEAGWIPVLGQQELAQSPLKTNYFRFTVPSTTELPADGARMGVFSLAGEQVRGVWAFTIVPATE